MDEAAPTSDGSLEYVLWFVERRLGFIGIDECSVIGDDFYLEGKSLEQFVSCLEDRYGQWVLTWPWDRIVFKRRTLSTRWLTIPVIGWFLAIWIAWPKSDDRVALVDFSLGHIANVLDHGEWIEP